MWQTTEKIQQNCGGQNNAINDRVIYNQNICSPFGAKNSNFCYKGVLLELIISLDITDENRKNVF